MLQQHPLIARMHRGRPGIIYIHIPKTGGSSLSAALRKHYRFSGYHVKSKASAEATTTMFGTEHGDEPFLNEQQITRLSLVHYAAALQFKYITGHFLFDEQLVNLKKNGYRIVTSLRHPVDRWYSAYFYGRYRQQGRGSVGLDFETYIGTEQAQKQGCVFSRYLGGVRPDGDFASAAAVAKAKHNLSLFDAIGFLEHKKLTMDRFSALIGKKLELGHRRSNPAPKALAEQYKQDKFWREKAESLCKPDIEIYNAAFGLFGK